MLTVWSLADERQVALVGIGRGLNAPGLYYLSYINVNGFGRW